MGQAIEAPEAMKESVITGVYNENSELDALFAAFAKEFAPRAANRKVLSEIKRKLHRDILIACEDIATSPSDIEIV